MLLCCRIPHSPTAHTLAALLSLSTPARTAKALRLATPHAQARSLAAGLLSALAAKRENTSFSSLSHSGSYAACVTGTRPVGVDVQKICTVKEGVPQRVCTSAELCRLALSTDYDRDFIRLWALKEAYFKAAGGESSLKVMATASFEVLGSHVTGPLGWHFSLHDFDRDYILAVCEQEE